MKHLIVGLALLLVVTSAWAGTYLDNFDAYEGGSIDDGNLGEWRRHKIGDQTAQWFVKDGELVCTSENVCTLGSSIIIGDSTWENYEVEVRFKIVKTFVNPCRSTNLAFSVRSGTVSDTGFFFGILTKNNAEGADWERFLCNQWVQGQRTATFPVLNRQVKQGVWYTVRMAADGDRYQVFWNDEQIVDSRNDTLDRGGVTLYLINAQAHFDNLRITGDTIPNRVMAVDSKAKFTTTWATIKQSR